ncbi:unnamed protein product [Vicia faba]|uniref:Uncharacterized protein n=1 Tax=Vicia faba TaxID=3906 RepID=A0AAV1AMW0_VICFA|nr:unnamed protein product [Vicia faba]
MKMMNHDDNECRSNVDQNCDVVVVPVAETMRIWNYSEGGRWKHDEEVVMKLFCDIIGGHSETNKDEEVERKLKMKQREPASGKICGPGFDVFGWFHDAVWFWTVWCLCLEELSNLQKEVDNMSDLKKEMDVHGAPYELFVMVVDLMDSLEENMKTINDMGSSLVDVSSRISRTEVALKEETERPTTMICLN